MNIKKILLVVSFLFNSLMVLGQGFSYTFTDPCTFKQKQIYIDNPSGSVLLTYNGAMQSFTAPQLQSGAMEQWVNQVNSQNPNGPCSGVGLAQNTNMNVLITQNSISVLTNVMSALSDVSSMGGTSIGGIVEAKEKSSSEDNKKKGNNPNNNGTQTNTNPTTNGQGGQTINNQNQGNGQNNEGNNGNVGTNQTNQPNQTRGGTNPNSGGESQGNGQSTETSGGNNGNTNTTPQGGNQTTQSTVNGGSSNQNNNSNNNTEGQDQRADGARSSSSAKEKVANAKQGGIVLNGDIVVIQSASVGQPQQFKINMSMVKSNTDNTLVKGALLNYTTNINNTSLTLFVGKRVKSFTGIVANSSMLNFQKDLFNTTSLMTSYKYKKITTTLGFNFTSGNLGDSRFQSISGLGGAVGTFKISKKINNTTMLVTVYSPFVYYYEGLWYKSGWLLVPFTAFDYRITQKFKLNLSFSGVQQIKSTPLNYQVLLGAKALL